jgi:hypothetical protein
VFGCGPDHASGVVGPLLIMHVGARLLRIMGADAVVLLINGGTWRVCS